VNCAVRVLLALSIAVAGATSARAGEVLDRVAALVNGEVVTLSEIRERTGGREDPGSLRRAFDQIVAEKLLQARAVELQVDSTDAQIDAAVEDIKKRNNFDEPGLEAALKEQGLDRATFRQNLKREYDAFLVLQHHVRGKVKLSDADLLNYYQRHPQRFQGEEEVHVRHVFLPLPEGAPEAQAKKVEAEAEKVRQRLVAGEDFAKVARQVSKGPSAEDGGDLGWLRRGTIDKRLEDAAFSLEKGKISPVVRAGPGLHVLTVEDRRRAGGKSFEEAKEEIRGILFEEQAANYRDQLIAELRRDAVVETKIPELKT
jgi:peptidyl-prolyl cis-trans isomerase SurA